MVEKKSKQGIKLQCTSCDYSEMVEEQDDARFVRHTGVMTLTDSQRVTVIGAGLAGSEAPGRSRRGIPVTLYEMRPVVKTPAHHTDKFAELVCSNSLRANGLTNAVGVLKEEMRMLNSLVIGSADRNSVPAGGALAVDRDGFREKLRKLCISILN